MPVFSLILPVYNTADFLEKCIDSILAQSFTDFEVILVDDGSTDNSLDICKSYRDTRIRIFERSNGGQSSARNFGMDRATGDYLWFVDSDDWISENALDILYGNITNDHIDILVFNHFENAQGFSGLAPVQVTSVISGIEYLNNYGLSRMQAWTSIYRRRFLLQTKLRFEEGMVYEDSYFNFYAYWYAQSVKGIKEFLYHYRIRANSTMTSRPSALHINSQLKVLGLVTSLTADKVYSDECLHDRLRYEMYFFLRQLWYSKPSKEQLQLYLTQIKTMGIIIPVHQTDSYIDYTIKRLFNRKPGLAYSIYNGCRSVKRMGQNAVSFRYALPRLFARSHDATA